MTDPRDLLNILIKTSVYSEPPSELHHSIITKVWVEIIQPYLKLGDQILDIGAGDGFAVQMFEQAGFHATAFNLHADDVLACERKELISVSGEMHDLPFCDKQYNFVQMRHVLEHSPFPMLALAEAKRVLKEDGLLYVEVPMAGTACQHETNPNHWTLFSVRMWDQLFMRSGFEVIDQRDMTFEVVAGVDTYLCWLLRKA
jgi:ubiquinone/menaquinone biosynthesis C-methylase UbiE